MQRHALSMKYLLRSYWKYNLILLQILFCGSVATNNIKNIKNKITKGK